MGKTHDSHQCDTVATEMVELHSQPADEDARRANRAEHAGTVLSDARAWPWAIFWSILVCMSVIMEGYDNSLVSNFYGYPAFRKQFGHYIDEQSGYQVSGPWQSAMGSAPVAGSIIGAFINGWAVSRFGYRPTFFCALILMNAFIFISFFGKTIELQVIGQLLCGQVLLPWGAFASIGPAYASEISPMSIRPLLTSYSNLCFVIGQFLSSAVIQSLNTRSDQWSYRVPLAIQWLWPVPLIVAALFMPESPWWLVRNGKLDAAQKTVQRLMSSSSTIDPKYYVAMMVHTNNIEVEVNSGTTYLDCFRGVDLRRTEIACMAFAGQVLCGIQFAYSPTYFFQQAGFDAASSYKIGLGGTALSFVASVGAWFTMKRFGRRPMYIVGLAVMAACLFVIGFLTFKSGDASLHAQAALCLLWLFTMSSTLGPLVWCLPAEVSSTRLRAQTVVLGRNSYSICQVFSSIIQPYMLNPSQWNWKGKSGFFWFVPCIGTLIWAYFRLPETKDRTYEELDIMFAARLPTRQFTKYKVDAYNDQQIVSEEGSDKI